MDKSYLPAVNKIIHPNHCPIFNPATLTPGSLPRKQNPLNPDQVGAGERESTWIFVRDRSFLSN